MRRRNPDRSGPRFPGLAWVTQTGIWQDYDLFIQELRHSPRLLALAIATSLAVSVLDGFGIGLLLSFLQSLIQASAPPLQTGLGWVDQAILGIADPPNQRILRLSALILGLTALRSVALYYSSLYTGTLSIVMLERLRLRILDQLQGVSLAYFTRIRSGDLVNTLTVELNKLKGPFLLLGTLVKDSFAIAIYSLALFLISWQLSLVSLALLVLLSVGLLTLRKAIREASFGISTADANFTAAAIEFINGIVTIHAHTALPLERQRFQRASQGILQANLRGIRGTAIVAPISTGSGTLILVGLIVSGLLVFQIPIVALLTFIYALLRLIPVVQEMNRVVTQLSFYQGAIAHVKDLLRPDNKPQFHNGTRPFVGLHRGISLQSLTFAYGDDDPVLHGVSLEIPNGQTTALVGASGSGKTTLTALLMRFYDAQQGQILLDGVDIREFDIVSLRRKMALVSQDPFIFNASVRDNITYGADAVDERRLQEAAHLANALSYIQDLPQGFHTLLGDRGVRLSGGQRQRLAIARALYRDPEILILDEATSALDSESESLIQSALDALKRDRTVIAIAHRLSTIANAHQVVVLEAGHIIEQGTYDALLARKGRFWHYHTLQAYGSLP